MAGRKGTHKGCPCTRQGAAPCTLPRRVRLAETHPGFPFSREGRVRRRGSAGAGMAGRKGTHKGCPYTRPPTRHGRARAERCFDCASGFAQHDKRGQETTTMHRLRGRC